MLSGSQAILDWRRISNALTETLRNSAFWRSTRLARLIVLPCLAREIFIVGGTLFCNPNFRVVANPETPHLKFALSVRPGAFQPPRFPPYFIFPQLPDSATKQPDQPDQDQIDRDDIVQKARDDQNQDPGQHRNEG